MYNRIHYILQLAIWKTNSTELVKLLLELGADPNKNITSCGNLCWIS